MALSSAAATSAGPPLAPPAPAFPGEHVRVGPLRLYVRRAGDPAGEPAVFVHGLGGSSTNWTDLMVLLADRLDEHAPDLPGFGHSDPPADGRYPLDLHVRAVAGYIERLGRGPVHLAGNSMGGAVAVRLAAERPELVRTLTLVSPGLPSHVPRRTDPRLPLLLLPGVSHAMVRILSRTPVERYATDLVRYLYADPSRVHPQRLAEQVEETTRRRGLSWTYDALVRSLRGLVRTYLEPGPRNLWWQLAAVGARRTPVLLVWGRQDRVVSPGIAPLAARRLGGCRLLLLDDAGHVAQMERPEAVAAAVRRLLDETQAPGS